MRGSNGCGLVGGRCGVLTISVIVSVKAQKYGGLSAQPIGRVRGKAINGVGVIGYVGGKGDC